MNDIIHKSPSHTVYSLHLLLLFLKKGPPLNPLHSNFCLIFPPFLLKTCKKGEREREISPLSTTHQIAIYPPSHRDILKLTAQFVARNGRSFIASLVAKEAKNHQFDFLKPSHGLYLYFGKLVEQYSKIMVPSTRSLVPVLEGWVKDKDLVSWCGQWRSRSEGEGREEFLINYF